MSIAYDVIIPVGYKDTGFVWRVVKYIRKYMPECDNIYILTSEKNFKYLRKINDNKTSLINENEVCKDLSFPKVSLYLKEANSSAGTGWYFQQFLKYGFALSKYAKKYYLSWDADTLPLTHINFFKEGKPMFTMKSEYNPNYFKTIQKLLELSKQVDDSFIAEHMMFDKDIVYKLIQKINSSNIKGENWIQKIINACDFKDPLPCFSEFETYGTFVMSAYKDMYYQRRLNTFRYGGFIRGRQISDKMLRKFSFDTDTMSFELGMRPTFPANLPDLWTTLKVKSKRIVEMGGTQALRKLVYKIKKHKDIKNKDLQIEKILYRD